MIFQLSTSKFCRILYLAGALLLPAGLRAQSACMLVPVALPQRVQNAPLVVEARVTSQQTERLPNSRHLVTRSQLAVYKVFKGQLPVGTLSVLTTGGTLGQEREEVTNTLALQPGEQGVFFLEADPAAPGEWRAYAGPQGLLRYDLIDLSASDPFGHYDAIRDDVQNRVAALAGAPYRELGANQPLQQAVARQAARQAAPLGPLATPSISGFSPASVVAGANDASSLLTISGSGFGSARGSVQFRNADSPGTTAAPTYTSALDSDVLQWSDTQIQVRVPSRSASGNAAGTGLVRVVDAASSMATSPGALTVTYALSNVAYSNTVLQTYRPHLLGYDSGGYALAYSTSFPDAAKAAFGSALQSWRCATGMNRFLAAATTTVDVTSGSDELNVVRFGGASELPAGVLGVTNSYYGGCGTSASTVTNWVLLDTDYTFAPVPYPGYTWNFVDGAPTGAQFDFQSVALHELGHGQQLTHIISDSGVMNYAISNGQTKRVLDPSTDIAGGNDVVDYSASASATERCNQAAFSTVSGCPLPVELTAFTAVPVPGQGVLLRWTTASERNSAAFVVESQGEAVGAWQEFARTAAAGTSTSTHAYGTFDPRPLAGTRYYRLRQIDLDGTTAYSPVVAVRAREVATVVAFPNPASSSVTLRGPLANGNAATVRLLDATGRCVARRTSPAGQATFDLPLTGVPAGLYLVEWTTGAASSHTRLVVE
jgi:hypothetical protein